MRISQALPGASLTGQQGQVVKIPAKSSVEVKVKLPKHSSKVSLMGIIVTPLPGSGPVYAARLASAGGTVVSILPVVSTPTVILFPHGRESLVCVLGQ